ncbi:hypothetical protein [Glutamicibacter arilaitensis]|uniref:hypothetical protein n=1 Tax=Glutamicibacter arilaitensis TaxID=256701 RepID=UPI0038507BB2
MSAERNTSGSLKKFENAFSASKVKSAIPLHGLRETVIPWFAVTIVGPSNQLQIISPNSPSPLHVISIPETHNGGLESMLWDERGKLLYLSTKGKLLVWDPRSPKKVREIGTVPQATTLYELDLDSVGNVWGGAYPNGAPFTYIKKSGEIRVYQRLAADTDYVRRLIIDENDQVWLGTGSRNPRIFTHPGSEPMNRTEIQLPQPMANGFISSLSLLGNKLVVSASNVPEQLLLDRTKMKWAGRLERMWSERRVSSSYETATANRYFSISAGYLYSTDTSTWKDSKLGQVEAASPIGLFATSRQVLILSRDADGLKTEFFDLATNKVQSIRRNKLIGGAYTIQSLLGLDNGQILIGGYMGSGLASIHPTTGERWHSPDSEDVINQVEGMIEFDSSLTYVGSYGGGDVISIDSRHKEKADSYLLLDRLGREFGQSRPFAWARNSHNVFFGTVPDYGLAGGVVGMIDPVANEIDWILDGDGDGFVRAHSIIGLDADEQYLYGTTTVRNGYGIPDTEGPSKVFKMEIATKKMVWISSPIIDAGALYSPKIVAGWLICADVEGVNIIDTITGKLAKRHRLTDAFNSEVRAGWTSANIALVEGGSRLVHSAANTTSVIDFRKGTFALIGSPKAKEKFGTRLAVTPDGRVYSTFKRTTLVELDLEPRQPAG